MQRIKHTSIGLAVAGLAFFCAAGSAGAADTEVVASTWQHHTITFPYFGRTSKYNCDGLENTVRGILLHFGARKDLKVLASGCGPANSPGRSAFVATDFYTLAPGADPSSAESVPAHWTAKRLDRDHPYFMDDGACELIDQMKDLITKSFTLKDLQYRTDCVPHDLNVHGFSVKGLALTSDAASKS
ncbi:MAG TPA: hypothetical protein VGI65_09975 [Steroidobacteraceae bacterium]|jgi:hypothetical protein